MDYQLNDFTCCPRCTTKGSAGFLVNEDCYIKDADVWLKYIKCVNCGWHHEVKALPTRKMVMTK